MTGLKTFARLLMKKKNAESVLFFTFGALRTSKKQNVFCSFDEFMSCISHYSTWSTSFGIWKKDFDELMKRDVVLDKMFPHTSLLFKMTDKRKYFVDDAVYFENQDVGNKGGYNLPETFGTRYLNMCRKLLEEKAISKNTFEKIKKSILSFISIWLFKTRYYPQKYYFEFDNWEKTVVDLYGKMAVYRIRLKFLFFYIKEKFKSITKKG